MLAASESIDLARLLLDLMIILIAAKLLGELAERVKVPAVIGEIVAGVVVGPSVLGLIDLNGQRGISVGMIAEIGVLLLLLGVGMETDLVELRKVGRASMSVAVIGVVVPFIGGYAVAIAFGKPTNTALFFGAALVATSVGITARVLGDLRALATREARIVLGAAVADDVLGLVILTVVVTLATEGSVGLGLVLQTVALAAGFLVVSGLLAVVVVPRVLDVVHRRSASTSTLTVAAVVITLAFAQLADAADLAFIIGAFMAGIGIGRSTHHGRVEGQLNAVGHVFIPVFFAQIGINADLNAMTDPKVLAVAGVTTIIAIIGKLVAAFGSAGTGADRWTIGIGMVPRGEVGLIFAAIGLGNGILDNEQYGALLIVVLLTTILAPPALRIRLAQTSRQSATLMDTDQTVDRPQQGWLRVSADHTSYSLTASPAPSQTASVALEAAQLATTAQPDEQLLTWFGTHRDAPLTWAPSDTDRLIELLRDHNPRSWRLLEATGTLDRALPEVATALARRRSDLSDLDPLGLFRFNTVRRLTEMSADISDDVVLAALATDVSTNVADTASLMDRLGRGPDGPRIASLVADAQLLVARAHDRTGLSDRERLHLSAHLADAGHAQKAFALANALDELPAWQHEALVQNHQLVMATLQHSEFHDDGSQTLADARRVASQALTTNPAAAERLQYASMDYLLSHDVEELARQAELLEPVPSKGRTRVTVEPGPAAGEWRVDVATRDSRGLLARLAEAFARQDCNILTADVATWPDGAVLDSFVVAASNQPDAAALAATLEHHLGSRLHAISRPDATLKFDQHSAPWRTVCSVSADDHVGTLQAIATAFAKANVNVHSALVTTSEGRARLRFELSDQTGSKLDPAAIGRIRRHLS